MVDHVEAFLVDVTDLHLFCPVELFNLIDWHIVSWVRSWVIAQTSLQFFDLELGCVKEFAEIVAKLPDVEDALELVSFHVDFHRLGLVTHHTSVQLGHLCDQSIRNGILDGVTLNVLGVDD